MFTIVETQDLAPGVRQFEIWAPRIAAKQKAGQFVILRLHEHGERIPLTIKESDTRAGTIKLVVKAIGKTTTLMCKLEAGDRILDVVGPLGKPSEVKLYGNVAVIGGGVGLAIALPTARAMQEAGNRVISIMGARSKEFVILEDDVRSVSAETYVVTDDGSVGEKALLHEKLRSLLDSGMKLDLVLAIGPVPMMRAVAEVTRPLGIKTLVSLNSIMVDGTGMCGGCRVVVANRSQFACVDGPEFDAHQVDFGVLTSRNNMYVDKERESLQAFTACPEHDLELVRSQCEVERLNEPEVAGAAKA